MTNSIKLTVNNVPRVVDVPDPETPLLYVLRDQLGLHGLHFGCGLARCGACTVHYDGEALRSCVMPISAVAGADIVTLEGLGTAANPHPLQQAFIDKQAAQCGYCVNGVIMQAAAFLAQNQEPNRGACAASARAEPLQVRHSRSDPACRHARRQADGLRWEPPMPDAQQSRRAFLKAGGALVVTFTLAPRMDRAQGTGWLQRELDPSDVASYLAIDNGGMVTLYSGKVELGTGAFTALTQIAAEELSVPLERVRTIQGDTALTPNQGPTYASLSVQVGGMQIRRAAATARESLLDLAAVRLKVAKDQLAIRAGVISPRSGGEGVSYAQLLGARKFTIQVNPDAPLKDPKETTRSSAPPFRASTSRRRSSVRTSRSSCRDSRRVSGATTSASRCAASPTS